MTAADIAKAKGASDVFIFDYDHADVAQTFVFDKNDWGLSRGTFVDVSDTVRPSSPDGGVWQASVTLFHLDAFSSAYISWEGTGFTVDYTLDNGANWTSLAAPGVIALSGDPDFDIRASWLDGTGELTSLTVQTLKTDTLSSTGSRTLAFSADAITGGALSIDSAVTVNASPLTPASLVGTIEMWATPTTTTVATTPAGVMYKNGAAGAATAGTRQHIVIVLNSAVNSSFTAGPNLVIDHLAVYPQSMTAAEVAALYAAQSPAPVRINDSGTITVTEYSPATDIYAYAWSAATR